MTIRQGELKVGWVNLYSYNLLVGSCYQLSCRAEGLRWRWGLWVEPQHPATSLASLGKVYGEGSRSYWPCHTESLTTKARLWWGTGTPIGHLQAGTVKTHYVSSPVIPGHLCISRGTISRPPSRPGA